MLHELEIKVRFAELDPYDHVNHAAFIGYLETARIEALEARGVSLPALRDEGRLLVVARLAVRFLRPAGAGDRLVVSTRVEEVGRASTRWRQQIHRAAEVLVEAEVIGAVTDLGGRPVRMPERIRQALEALG